MDIIQPKCLLSEALLLFVKIGLYLRGLVTQFWECIYIVKTMYRPILLKSESAVVVSFKRSTAITM